MNTITQNQDTTPNTEEPKVTENMLMCNVSISYPHPQVKDAGAQRVLKDTFQCDEGVDTGTVTLLKPSFSEGLRSAASVNRRFFAENTLSLGKRPGSRGGMMTIIPTNNYWRVIDYWHKSKNEWDLLAQDYVDRWEDEIRPESKKSINLHYNNLSPSQRAWYEMSAEQVADKIYYLFSKDPLAGPGATASMQGLTADLRADLEVELQDKYDNLAEEANSLLRERLAKVVSDLKKKMNSYNPDGGRMSDTILENVRDLIKILPDMCIGDNSAIVELVDEAKLICHWDVDMLKGEEGNEARKEVAKDASNLLKKIEGGNTAADITKMMSL
jgi:anti-sigma28 factor (negative regulator of flagellin synthesis)